MSILIEDLEYKLETEIQCENCKECHDLSFEESDDVQTSTNCDCGTRIEVQIMVYSDISESQFHEKKFGPNQINMFTGSIEG